MEKKKNKDPCAGCVWKLWTGTSEKEPDHEEKAPDD